MHSIRFKITAITVGAILTAIVFICLASFPMVKAESDRQSVKTMNLVCQDTRNSLEKYTDGVEQSVEFIADYATDGLDSVELVMGGVVGSAARKSRQTPEQAQRLDAYLIDYYSGVQRISGVVAAHTLGIITYYYCISPDISQSAHGFFYSRVGKAGFYEREPLDARELDPNDIEHTTWYYTPIERGRPSWVGPYTAHFLDEMLICSYLVPIYQSGTLIGVLGMDIPVENLVDFVSAVKVYDSGFACLMDSEGRILYHPEKEAGSTLDLEVSQNIFQQEDNGDELIRYMVNGQERQLSFTTLSNGMKLAVVAPVEEINMSTTKLIGVVLLVMVIIVIIFAALAMLVMRLVTKPLVRLTAASQQLAAQDYDVELNYDSKDEIGALTSSFKQMRDQLQKNIEDLNRQVLTDDLTGLPNQRHFFQLAKEQKQRLLEDGKHPVVLYFNLMGMKHFNRQYGFTEGDQLIREVAGILAGVFGEHNTSRFGQDHFAAIVDEEHVEARLADVFEQCQGAHNGVNLPVSVGIYQFSMEEEASVSIACDRAKFACDQRRGFYASGFRYFDAGMLKQLEDMRYIINHFDQALEENWIVVHYQPIVRAVNGKVCDEEALSRWVDPTRGTLRPDDFIPALEGAGLIYRLDLYVVDRVLEKIKMQRESGLTIVPHSINLSRSDFEACDIVEEICKRVDAAGVERNKLSIEITESIIGADFDFMKEQIERFQSLGFPVWMDDFGSGYSSLDVLEDIKFDLIKFDLSFTRKIESEEGRIILTELMKMAKALGVDTICEGVETEEQRRFLQEIGCAKLQGFLFCKAITLDEIIERNRKGIQIGYESPEETERFEAVGKVL